MALRGIPTAVRAERGREEEEEWGSETAPRRGKKGAWLEVGASFSFQLHSDFTCPQ